MIPPWCLLEDGEGGIPRESGDDPVTSRGGRARPPVFPARAGMIRRFAILALQLLGIPRESGDDPFSNSPFTLLSLYSPRERG